MILRGVQFVGGEHECVIDPFRHRQLTPLGWQTVIYRLTIDEDAQRMAIRWLSGIHGKCFRATPRRGRWKSQRIAIRWICGIGDILLWTDEAGEVLSWIAERQRGE